MKRLDAVTRHYPNRVCGILLRKNASTDRTMQRGTAIGDNCETTGFCALRNTGEFINDLGIEPQQ